jgi:hypothetical protein
VGVCRNWRLIALLNSLYKLLPKPWPTDSKKGSLAG